MKNDSIYYVIDKQLLDDIISSAKLKKANSFQELNESWIEGNVSIQVVEYIIENSSTLVEPYPNTND